MKSLLVFLIRPKIGDYLTNYFRPQVGDIIEYQSKDNRWVVLDLREKRYICYQFDNPNYIGQNSYSNFISYKASFAGTIDVSDELIQRAKNHKL